MARLQHSETGVEVHLAARHIVGRSRASTMRLVSDKISGVHAEFIWEDGCWQLRDLGSRNGTFLNDHKLAAGDLVRLEPNAMLGFGSPEPSYRVLDLDPPRLMAVTTDGHTHHATGEILSLPDVDQCVLTIFRDRTDRWVCEGDDDTRAITDQELVVIDGLQWRICLPGPDRTRVWTRDPTLADIKLEFAVSRDQEHVDISVVHSGGATPLETRAHAFLLLELARARIEDNGQNHLVQRECGWRYREDLMKSFGVGLRLLNLWVFRARKQLAAAGVAGAADLVERRANAQQLRIGVENLHISMA